mgnify:CR=1 FL=1
MNTQELDMPVTADATAIPAPSDFDGEGFDSEGLDQKRPIIDVDVVLNDLEQAANDFSDHIQKIRLMQENGFYKYASKKTRNELMDSMRKQMDTMDDLTKLLSRSMNKTVKRIKVPDEVVDLLLVSAVLPGRL